MNKRMYIQITSPEGAWKVGEVAYIVEINEDGSMEASTISGDWTGHIEMENCKPIYRTGSKFFEDDEGNVIEVRDTYIG